MSTWISLHAAARDETRRQAAVAESLRGNRAHTRATVADELARPADGHPPLYQAVLDASRKA